MKTLNIPPVILIHLLKVRLIVKNILSSPERIFLIVGGVFGVAMLIVMPPFMVPDEGAHLMRTYQVSEGGVFSKIVDKKMGGSLPLDIIKANSELSTMSIIKGGRPAIPRLTYLKHKVNFNDKEFVAFNNTALYSPVAYIPQSIGINIAKVAYPSPLAMVYLGRVCNFLFFVLAIFFAIRYIPVGKWALTVIALIPMTIHQAISLSSDVMTISLAFLAVSLLTKLMLQKSKITSLQVRLLLILALLLGLVKPTFALFILPVLALSGSIFPDNKFKTKVILGALIAAFGSTLIWYLAIRLLHYNLDVGDMIVGSTGINPAGQIAFVLTHPLGYLSTLFNTFLYNRSSLPSSPDNLWISTYGVFSWLVYGMPWRSAIIGFGLLAASLIVYPENKDAKSMTTSTRATFITICCLMMLASATVLYISWTKVGSPVIEGLQGRYFLPILPLLAPGLVAIKSFHLKISQELFGVIVALVSSVNLCLMVLLTYRWFHGVIL
jgi:uncharacterized membrane protein